MLKTTIIIVTLLCCLTGKAQVQVRFEPRHHNVFENEYARILDVFLMPGDTTQYHIHNTPSVFITFVNAKTGSQLLGKNKIKGTAGVSNAQTALYDSLPVPRIHRVWNEDSAWFHVMDIELTGGKPKSEQPVLKNDFLQQQYNAPLANVYRLHLPAAGTIRLPVTSTGYLLLSTAATKTTIEINDSRQQRIMQAGHYLWINANDKASVYNGTTDFADFILLQLK